MILKVTTFGILTAFLSVSANAATLIKTADCMMFEPGGAYSDVRKEILNGEDLRKEGTAYELSLQLFGDGGTLRLIDKSTKKIAGSADFSYDPQNLKDQLFRVQFNADGGIAVGTCTIKTKKADQ